MKNENKPVELLKCSLLSIDAWHDDASWCWNSWHEVEKDIYIPEYMTNRQLINLFRDSLEVINENSKGKVAIDDDGYNIVLIHKDTLEPLFALCYGEFLYL